MLFSGGLDGSLSLFLLALTITAVGVAASILIPSEKKQQAARTYPMQAFYFAIYAPLILVAMNLIPDETGTPALMRYLTLPLAITCAVLGHACLYLVSYKSVAREQITNSPPTRAIPTLTLVNTSIADYKTEISRAEAEAKELAYIQHRVAPYFLSDSTLESIAEKRFGNGSANAEVYIEQHLTRRRAFYTILGKGLKYREIYPRARILEYVASGTHAEQMWPLTTDQVVDTITSWANALEMYPNYYVGISDSSIPIKYHVIDHEILVIHEPVGPGDSRRLNSIMTYDRRVGGMAMADFEQLWDDVEIEWRNSKHLVEWIRTELVELAVQRTTDIESIEKPGTGSSPTRTAVKPMNKRDDKKQVR